MPVTNPISSSKNRLHEENEDVLDFLMMGHPATMTASHGMKRPSSLVHSKRSLGEVVKDGMSTFQKKSKKQNSIQILIEKENDIDLLTANLQAKKRQITEEKDKILWNQLCSAIGIELQQPKILQAAAAAAGGGGSRGEESYQYQPKLNWDESDDENSLEEEQ